MSEWKRWAGWVIPIGALSVMLGWQLNWGRPIVPHVSDAIPATGKPMAPALLPEYKIEGGVETLVETVNRTLFNPTRRPAPPVVAVAVVEPPKPRLKTGQFVLTGVSGVGDTRTAFLREVAGGKVKMVKQGEQINGLTVAEVQPTRVILKLGDETEDLGLRIVAGPRSTIAAAPPPGAAPLMPSPGMPGLPVPGGLAGGASVPSAALGTIEERRRAARAAEAAAAAGRAPQPAGAAASNAAAAPAPVDPAWNSVYQRYMQRSQPQ